MRAWPEVGMGRRRRSDGPEKKWDGTIPVPADRARSTRSATERQKLNDPRRAFRKGCGDEDPCTFSYFRYGSS